MKTLNEKQKEIKGFGVRKIGLFGSFQENKQTKQSDIDILVEFKRGTETFDNYMDLKFLLERVFPGRRIDLVLESTLKPSLRAGILSETLYVA